jgi:DNA primase
MFVLCSTWRLRQGVSFAPISTMGILQERHDVEIPTRVHSVSSTIDSTFSTMNTAQSSSSPPTNKTVTFPLRMPTMQSIGNKPTLEKIQNGKKLTKFFVPKEVPAKPLASIDIVSLIECYGIPQFSKTADGTRASCLCPFHDDHNPSLKMDGNRGIFKCFSCGVGGNALSFVREYSKLHGTELSFLEAVKLLDDMVVTAAASSATLSDAKLPVVLPVDIAVPMGARPSAKNMTVSKTDGTVQKKSRPVTSSFTKGATISRQRAVLANFHAASFYNDCLLTRLDAGAARYHLGTRNIHPATVKEFAIGFAPETYFMTGSATLSSQPRAWGEGSLVQYLRDRGFTPQEIIDSGLAIRTQRGKRKMEEIEQNNSNDANATLGTIENDYSTLMDRFRGRLIIPIFDSTGSHVLGFGGRILESVSSGSDFKAAKYLNSPESIIFQKKEVLFGQHMAEKSTWIGNNNSKPDKSDGPRSIVIVEGYMDAIALWQAGVRETVASMGTALSLEQLDSAAKSARNMGGESDVVDACVCGCGCGCV